MSGSLVLRSGVGTQILMVSRSRTTEKSVVAPKRLSLTSFAISAEGTSWMCDSPRFRPVIFDCWTSIPVTVKPPSQTPPLTASRHNLARQFRPSPSWFRFFLLELGISRRSSVQSACALRAPKRIIPKSLSSCFEGARLQACRQNQSRNALAEAGRGPQSLKANSFPYLFGTAKAVPLQVAGAFSRVARPSRRAHTLLRGKGCELGASPPSIARG